MANAQYFVGRKKYHRPQAVAWSNNPGTLIGGIYVPTGQEDGADPGLTEGGINEFLILSDHNRSELAFNPIRIQQRERMVNGNIRSYHIADKMEISFNWSNLPSRSYRYVPNFNSNGVSQQDDTTDSYTVDGGAGGVELLNWYESHRDPFYMFLAYDKYNNFGTGQAAREHFVEYNQLFNVYIVDFKYEVLKRGNNNHDLWNVSVTLEEV